MNTPHHENHQALMSALEAQLTASEMAYKITLAEYVTVHNELRAAQERRDSLLVANNQEMERRRTAEAEVLRLKRIVGEWEALGRTLEVKEHEA